MAAFLSARRSVFDKVFEQLVTMLRFKDDDEVMMIVDIHMHVPRCAIYAYFLSIVMSHET